MRKLNTLTDRKIAKAKADLAGQPYQKPVAAQHDRRAIALPGVSRVRKSQPAPSETSLGDPEPIWRPAIPAAVWEVSLEEAERNVRARFKNFVLMGIRAAQQLEEAAQKRKARLRVTGSTRPKAAELIGRNFIFVRQRDRTDSWRDPTEAYADSF